MQIEELIQEKVRFKENDPITYSSLSEPCEDNASGDFTGVKTLTDGRTLFYIGDVSGHGRKAASLSKKVEKIIDYSIKNRPQIRASELAEQINKYLPLIDKVYNLRIKKIHEQVESKNRKHKIIDPLCPDIVTAFFAIYDPKTQLVDYANAGHGPIPLYFPDIKNPEESFKLKSENLFIGMFPQHQYEDYTIILRKAKTGMIFMATDGVTERRIDETGKNGVLNFFGEERLVNTLMQNIHRTEPELITSVYKDAYEFGLPQSNFEDDVSLMAITIKQ